MFSNSIRNINAIPVKTTEKFAKTPFSNRNLFCRILSINNVIQVTVNSNKNSKGKLAVSFTIDIPETPPIILCLMHTKIIQKEFDVDY